MSLTAAQYAVLGMVSLQPMTGYEIRKAYQKGPANFMPISFGQIYPILARLEKGELIRAHAKPGTRGSVRYAITRAGERVMHDWVVSKGSPDGYRELLLRIFFAKNDELPMLQGALSAFREEHQAELERYDETGKWLDTIAARTDRVPTWKLVMDYGILQSQAYVTWTNRALAFIKKGK